MVSNLGPGREDCAGFIGPSESPIQILSVHFLDQHCVVEDLDLVNHLVSDVLTVSVGDAIGVGDEPGLVCRRHFGGEPRGQLDAEVKLVGQVPPVLQVKIDPLAPFGDVAGHQLVDFVRCGGGGSIDIVVIRHGRIVGKEKILFPSRNEL